MSINVPHFLSSSPVLDFHYLVLTLIDLVFRGNEMAGNLMITWPKDKARSFR